jgi:hypothetical protein
MEQRGTTMASLADLDDLRDLVARPWPFLSAYLAFEPATEALAREVAGRWRSRRRSLAAAGAGTAALDAVDHALDGAHRGGAGLAVVVPDGGEPLVERLVSPPSEGATWSRVPALRPLIALRQRHVAHVVALVDRTGADLRAWSHGETVGDEVTATVTGDDRPVRKVAPGGWSQRRFQQRAEDSWLHNMGQVAEEVTRLAERTRARLVAVGGDERAVGLLLDALPAPIEARVHRIGAPRAADGTGAAVDEAVAAELDGWGAGRVGAALALHAEELGQGDRATSGAGRTLEALRAARVALLLVAEGRPGDEDRQVWVGPSTDQVATATSDLASPDAAVAAPLLDAAVAAALTSGADVMVVPRDEQRPPPASLGDGLGALLRW